MPILLVNMKNLNTDKILQHELKRWWIKHCINVLEFFSIFQINSHMAAQECIIQWV